MKLLIISHTRHYKNDEGNIEGWGPTVNELNKIVDEFDEIVHVAMLHLGKAPQSSLPYTSSKIKFVALPALGGKTILSKIKMLVNAPKLIRIVSKELKNSDLFQLRTPTGIGLILIPFLTFFSTSKGWYKYAGNWQQKNKPLGFRLQKWMLLKQKRKVTINGTWEEQPQHVLTFENPCLTEEDRNIGKIVAESKTLSEKKIYCFVGGLNSNKGIDRILEVLQSIPSKGIETFHIVGDGELRNVVKEKAGLLNFEVKIHGSLAKDAVREIYKKAHFIILPSKNEGFPKVIGEAMNYGCVPIVSDVSCIGQYIKNDYNGYLIHPNTNENLKAMIEKSCVMNPKEFKECININYTLAKKFTYQYYMERIKMELLN